jgi:protein phosphatase slingshot
MLYILPPPRTPNPPSPWESILYSGAASNGSTSWEGNRKPPRVRLRGLLPRNEDGSTGPQDDNMDTNRNPKSLSECYFAGKGTALVLPAAEAQKSSRRPDAQDSNIRKHLQSIVDLLRPEETLKMAVKLESVHPTRIRYLVIVSRMGKRGEESCLLGIDCNERTTVGLVLKVMADTAIRLDGDGGFSVSVCSRHHIFKPVSVQAMWSALQTLHKVSSKAREQNYFQGGLTHDWVDYYEKRIESDRSCLNEWHAMDNLESKRPPSPDSIRTKPREREETEKVIRTTLKEIMMSVDLDEVTSKYIRTRLEEDLDMDLGEYKSFIDQEMLTILGQMDAPTEIFDHVYLGSEWNASNYEELQRNGVGHILNVTREIDNFFPGTFNYYNVRVCDDEKTDLLKYWDDTFKYITSAKRNGSKVLVHCKMGVSRSASVVIAYAMKAYNWDFRTAMHHVKEKRTCIKPNTSFLSQLETYQGILDAMKNKEKLQRSKSETNLKSPTGGDSKPDKILVGSEPTPIVRALPKHVALSGQDLRNLGTRPKSWSPDNLPETEKEPSEKSPVSVSLEDLSQKSASKESVVKDKTTQARHVLMPCDNGESYSVSQNQIVHLPGQHKDVPSVKERVSELESNSRTEENNSGEKSPPTVRANLPKKEIWDPGDDLQKTSSCNSTSDSCDSQTESSSAVVSNNNNQKVWTSLTVLKNEPDSAALRNSINQKGVRKDGDPFSNQLDRVFDREEKKQQRISTTTATLPAEPPEARECPSRQSSWSSYDSAVVLQNEVGLSRHSSWGSGDTRLLPSRNSSWGSYDMRPKGAVHYRNEKGEKVLHAEYLETGSSGIFPYDKEDIPWHPGTVKRTKQKIEENNVKNGTDGTVTKSSSSETLFEYSVEQDRERQQPTEAINAHLIKNLNVTTVPSPSAISPTVGIPGDGSGAASPSRLSVSAPEPSCMDLVATDCSLSRSASNVSASAAHCSSVRQHRTTFLENLPRELNSKTAAKTADGSTGVVKSLKKEFEAKTNNEAEIATATANKVNSLPASPVSLHQDKERVDEMNFKNLLGMFENNNTEAQVTKRPKTSKPVIPRNARFSCVEVSSKWKGGGGERGAEKPPMSPVVRNSPQCLMATVIASATKKQQQYGKSHPLAKLTINRHNNPLYNTM